METAILRDSYPVSAHLIQSIVIVCDFSSLILMNDRDCRARLLPSTSRLVSTMDDSYSRVAMAESLDQLDEWVRKTKVYSEVQFCVFLMHLRTCLGKGSRGFIVAHLHHQVATAIVGGNSLLTLKMDIFIKII